jgi:hypothetical protein
MMQSLPPLLRRSIAVGILVALVLGVLVLIWMPFGYLRDQTTQLADLGRHIDALEERVHQRDQLLSEQRLLQRANEADRTLLQAATPALAAAELQRELTDLVRRGGGTLDSVQVLEPVQVAPFVQVGLRVSFTAQLEGLRSVLYAVEQHAPVLLVRELSATETEIYNEDNSASKPALSTVIEVLGYARANATS